MSTNTQILRKIVAEFPNLQHEKKTLEGNHEMTFREAIRALYPTLRDMKKRGFSTREIAEKLMRGRQRVAAEKGTNNTSIFSQYLSMLTVGLGSMSL